MYRYLIYKYFFIKLDRNFGKIGLLCTQILLLFYSGKISLTLLRCPNIQKPQMANCNFFTKLSASHVKMVYTSCERVAQMKPRT